MGASCESHSDEPSVPRTHRTHQSPRRVRERTEDSAKQRELLSDKTPGQRVFPGVSEGQRNPLSPPGGQEVAGSNPASPTERSLAPQGFFSLRNPGLAGFGPAFLVGRPEQGVVASCLAPVIRSLVTVGGHNPSQG